MTKKIFKAVFLTSFLLVVSSLLIISTILFNYYSAEQVNTLKEEMEFVRTGIDMNGTSFLDHVKTQQRVTLIDANGKVLYDTAEDASKMENHANREEVQEALKDGTGVSTRVSKTLDQKTVYYAEKLPDGHILRVSMQRLSFGSVLLGLLQPFLFILVGAGIVSWILAGRIAKSIIEPLSDIDLDHPLTSESYDELAPLLRKVEHQNEVIQLQMDSLEKERRDFELITENMNEGILVLDSKMDVLSHNASALNLLDTELPEDNQNVLIYNRSRTFRKLIKRAYKGKQAEKRMEIGERIIQMIANPVIENGKVEGVAVILFDITEKENREKLRSEFVSNVSHELKTPLTSISGYAEIIENGMAKPEDVRGFAGKIYSEAQALIAMVNDILELSRLDENRSLEPEMDVNLTPIVNETIERLGKRAEKQRVTLSAAMPDELNILGYSQIITEMIYNLVDNAIKYNKPGGTVLVSGTESETSVDISVADTGIGIPAAEQERIFERFYRVSKSRSRDVPGSGLGLAIIKHGAVVHNAEVLLESSIGEGTTFTIRFEKPDTAEDQSI